MGTRLLRWAWMPVIALLVALAIVLRPDGGSAPAGAQADNAMAVDADPSGDPDDIDASAQRLLGQQFQVSVDITSVGTPYWGYDLLITYAPANLSFIPTFDYDEDTSPESWEYTDLGGMTVQQVVSETPDWPAPGTNLLVGGAARSTVTTTTATGQAVIATFQCLAAGTSTLHLVAQAESSPYTGTLGVDGELMPTTLADATITCAEATPTPTATQVGVGGIAELPALAGASAEEAGAQGDESGWSAGRYAALAGGLAAAAVLVAAAGTWYARRRWLR